MLTTTDVRLGKPHLYREIDLSLLTALNNYEIDFPGEFAYFWVDGLRATPYLFTGGLSVKFNEVGNDAIPIRNNLYYKIPFYRLFITSQACGSGYSGFTFPPALHIILGADFENFSCGFLGEEQAPFARDILSGFENVYCNYVANATLLLCSIPNDCWGLVHFYHIRVTGGAAGIDLGTLFVTDSSDTTLYNISNLGGNVPNPSNFNESGSPNLKIFPGDKIKIKSGASVGVEATVALRTYPIVY